MVTSQTNIAGMGLCTLVSAKFLWFGLQWHTNVCFLYGWIYFNQVWQVTLLLFL